MFGKVEQFVQFGVEAGPEQPAFGDQMGRAVHQCAFQQVEIVGQVVPALQRRAQERGAAIAARLSVGGVAAVGRFRPFQHAAHLGEGGQALAQGHVILGGGAVQEDARGQPFKVVHLVQPGPQVAPGVVALVQPAHRRLGFLYGAHFAPGVAQAFFQQSAPHGGLGVVQHVPQRARPLAAIQAAEDFQIALRHFIDDEVAAQVQGAERRKVDDVLLLGLHDICQQRPAGTNEFILSFKTQRAGVAHALGVQQPFRCCLEVEGGPARHPHHLGGGERHGRGHLCVLGHQQFAGLHLAHPLPQVGGLFRMQARPFARGKIEPGKAARLLVLVPEQRAQIIVALGVEVGVLHHRAGGQHAGDGALDQPLGLARVFYLVAQGHLEALFQQLGDVPFHRMVGHAAHGHAQVGVGVAAGEGDLQFARRRFRIVEEHFVEVAHAVEQQRIRMILLDAQVLLEHGGELRRIGAGRRRRCGPGQARSTACHDGSGA
ncbi:hypothetical protein DSECCO2_615280 [anaerobic digester metagenome]